MFVSWLRRKEILVSIIENKSEFIDIVIIYLNNFNVDIEGENIN